MAAAAGQPGSRPDATGRRSEYLPAAVLGNGALLVDALGARRGGAPALAARGRAESRVRAASRTAGRGHDLLARRGRECVASVVGGGRHLRAPHHGGHGVRHGRDRRRRRSARAGARSPGHGSSRRRRRLLRGAPRRAATLETGGHVDPSTGAMVFYRRAVALAIATDAPAASAAVASHNDMPDAVAHLGPLQGLLEARQNGVVHVVFAFASSPFEALARASAHAAAPGGVVARRRAADARGPRGRSGGRRPPPGAGATRRRSVLVLDQLTDRATGGIVAAPEMDERFVESGGYGFVWPRDLSYVVLGLLAAGRGEPAAAALRWLVRVQAPEGLWLHRHWTTGELAPSWGLHQLDETGVVLFAAEAAWEQLRDESPGRRRSGPRPGGPPTSSSGSSTRRAVCRRRVWTSGSSRTASTPTPRRPSSAA